jgi:two-component system nitrate/nitrite response regulator NarL
VRIALCDDHALLSEALAVLFGGHGHDVVWQATSTQAAVVAMRDQPVDVLLLDLSFPDGDSVDAIPELLASCNVRIVLLSGSDDFRLIGQAVAAGATGVVSKTEDTAHIIDVVERVGAGDVVIDQRALHAAVAAAGPRKLTPRQQLATFLTSREREVLERLVRGQETATLAKELGIRYSTARTHIQSVLVKLGVHSKLEAVAFAISTGTVTVEDDEAAAG